MLVNQPPPIHPSEAPSFLDGYYEGATEEGDQVAFLVRSPVPDVEPDRRNFPWQAAVIASFSAKLHFLVVASEEGDFDDTMTFDAEDVPIIDNGTFTYSGGDVPLLFGLNGLLLPNGQASGDASGLQIAPSATHGARYFPHIWLQRLEELGGSLEEQGGR